jgi:hypothetical protein
MKAIRDLVRRFWARSKPLEPECETLSFAERFARISNGTSADKVIQSLGIPVETKTFRNQCKA